MCEEDIFEGLLQEIIYCAVSGHTDKWEEDDWREWLRPQVEEIYQKSNAFDQIVDTLKVPVKQGSVPTIRRIRTIIESINNGEVRSEKP